MVNRRNHAAGKGNRWYWGIFVGECLSNSVLASPFTSCGLVSWTVGLIDVCDLGHQRVIRVGVCEHRADRKEYFRDCQSRAPLVTQDVETNASVGVDVGVVDASAEVDLGRLERVVGREVDCEEEDASRVRRVTRTHDSCLPVEQIISDRTGRAGGGGVPAKISEFLVNALESHVDDEGEKKSRHIDRKLS
jgi:hypothetical protein